MRSWPWQAHSLVIKCVTRQPMGGLLKLKAMELLTDWLPEEIRIKVFLTLISLGMVMLIRYLISRLVFDKIRSPSGRYRWQKAISIGTGLLVILFVMRIWVEGIDSLATYLGLISAGLAVALKDPIVNFAGWLFIISRKPFELGDRIQVGDHIGDIIDIRLFQFTLSEIRSWVDADQSTGRLVHIPNGKVFSESQINYNQGFTHIWEEIGVLVTFESNWKKAKEIIQQILNDEIFSVSSEMESHLLEISKQYLVRRERLNPKVFTSVKDSGVMLTARYIVHPQKRRSRSEHFWENLLNNFSEHKDIDFAYPTQRFYNNRIEGKEAKPT